MTAAADLPAPQHATRPTPRRGSWAHRLWIRSGRARKALAAEATDVITELARLHANPPDEADLPRALAQCKQGLKRAMRDSHDRAAGSLSRAHTLALIALAAERALGLRPHDNQILAALAMHEGFLVQLAPGEGKTLAVAMAAVLYSFTRGACHVVTSNDYLARRDAEEMAPLYTLCGCTVSFVTPDIAPDDLARRYRATILYATGQQLLADHLRDQILLGGLSGSLRKRLWSLRQPPGARLPVMRGLVAAIVDEADSVLIDEATTPLIISVPGEDSVLSEAIYGTLEIVAQLEEGRDFEVFKTPSPEVRLTAAGGERVATLAARLPAFWAEPSRRNDLVRMVIMSRECFQRDRHYVIQQGRVVIVDENTGRMMTGRSWSYGIHQAIEAWEGLEITQPTRTVARMTFQNFFRLYPHLSGASGTLQGIGRELVSTYRLFTLDISTRLPVARTLAPLRCFATREEKIRALVDRLCALNQRGLPVLVGTRRIQDSEEIASHLRARGIECQVLNAKHHAEEARIVARAGEAARVTVATNMAGRGTDIKLAPGLAQKGGLQVLMFEPHGSARVDHQLIGRSGRQGAPGHVEPYISLDDELLRQHLPGWRFMEPLMARIGFSGVQHLMRLAQWRAQRAAWRYRRQLARRDTQIDQQLSFSGKS